MSDQPSDLVSFLVPSGELTQAAMKDIKTEIFNEQIEMVRDYVKGMYRYRNDIEKKIKQVEELAAKQVGELKGKIKLIDETLAAADKGQVDALKRVKVPVNYLDEKTVRLAGMEWLTPEAPAKE